MLNSFQHLPPRHAELVSASPTHVMLNLFQHPHKISDMKSDTYNAYTYIMTNKNNTVLYIGVTNDLYRRVVEHKEQKNQGFTAKYNLTKLVYFEGFSSIIEAIDREKQLKRWHRDWKFNLIKEKNPNMEDLLENPNLY